MNEEEVDFFDVLTVTSFIAAIIGDLSFFFIIGLFIPVIGLVIGCFILCAHYASGALILALFWKKAKGRMAKGALILAFALPLPLLLLGIVSAIILSNKFVADAAEQALIQGIAAATGGAGEVLEAGVATEEAASIATESTEAVGAIRETATSAEAGVTAGTGEVVGVEGAVIEGGATETPSETPTEGPSETPREIEEKKAQEEPGTVPSKEGEVETPEEQEGAQKKEELEQEMEPEAEQEPEEVAKRNIFENTPTPENKDQDEEDEDEAPEPPKPNNGPVLIDEAANQQKAAEVKREENTLKMPGEVTTEEWKKEKAA
jgi:type IV secretory pathway TrbL component